VTSPETTAPDPGGRPVRVLVCDDQTLIRTGYATIFAAQPDLEVVGEASDGQQAVDSARRLRPDVVVMDIRMPVLDGIEATRLLAGPGVADPARVLVVTTFNVDEYVYDALRAGASGFLLKDALPAELVDGVRTIARGESLLAPAVTRHLIGHFATRIRASDPAAPGEDHPLATLTEREREVLTHIAAGLSNAEIAATLFVSEATVKTHINHIFTKTGLRDRAQLVGYAFRHGLATPG
jgi:DNA-binding NarL/FixJ family response regulator